MAKSLTPHSAKREVVLFYIGSFIGPYPVITTGNETISWVCHARLLGVTKDHKTYVDKAFYRIKDKLCQQAQLAKKVLFPDKKISSRLIFQNDAPFGDLRNHPLGKLQ